MTHTSMVVIGVAGGSGSGKTSVVRAIMDRFNRQEIELIEHDSYYRDLAHLPPDDRARFNFDHPDSLETDLLVRHIGELRAGQPVEVPVYDYGAHTRSGETRTVQPTPVLIVEGILAFVDDALRDTMDIRVFVDTDNDLRILRRMERDVVERNRSIESIRSQYIDTVRPMHLEFVEPSRRTAHIIVPDGVENLVALDLLMTKVESILS